MAVELNTTGSGTIGEITPGWSVQEYATPVIPGSRAGGAGGVSLSGKRNTDSAFIVNNDSTFTHSALGNISGVIKTVNLAGEVASITQSSDLFIFDGEEEIPGLVSGGVHQTVDLLHQITKKDIRLKSGLTGGFWSLAGHNAGFDSSGNRLAYKEYQVAYSWIGSPSNTNYKKNIMTCRDALWVEYGDHYYRFGKLFADYVRGDTIVSNVNKPNYFVAFKSFIDSSSGYCEWAVEGGPFDSVTNTDRDISVKINRSTNQVQIFCDYRSGGTVVSDNVNATINGSIDTAEELAVFIEYNLVAVNVGSYSYEIIATVCNTSDYSIYTTATLSFDADAMPIYYDQWRLRNSGTGAEGYRSVWVDSTTSVKAIEEWENEPSYSLSNDVIAEEVLSRAVLGGKYNMWQFLQDACSAHGQDVSISNGVTLIRMNGELQLDITNVVASPSLSVDSSFSGQTVDIIYSGSSVTNSNPGIYTDSREEVYNVYTDKNKIISVNASEIITTTVKTDNYLLSVLPTYKSSTFPNVAGAYAVCDSTGGNVTNSEWAAYGGAVIVSINEDNQTAIDIKVIGPTREIPGKTAPYSLAYSSGEEKYAALSILGTAIKGAPVTLSLLTGAPEDKSAQRSSARVENPHIGSVGKAYTGGLWVSSNASGPRVSFSGNMPISSISGFGLTAGSLFRYEDAIYRVDSTSIGNVGLSITATLYTRCDDFDTLWSAKTVQYHDELWSGYQVQDQIIKPLWNASLSGVYMTFDVDGIVTWTDEPYGEATFALDTDGVPYVIASGDDESNTLIYLDTDFTPYYV